MGEGVVNLVASFQKAVVDTLVRKSILACKLKKVNRLLLGGGVVANNYLREKFTQAAHDYSLKCYFPPKEICMDNAAMVAGLGSRLFREGHRSDLYLNPDLD